jgi:hypothetical protein
MDEITLELDDELVSWLESASSAQNKPVSQIIGEWILEYRASSEAAERSAN